MQSIEGVSLVTYNSESISLLDTAVNSDPDTTEMGLKGGPTSDI